MKSSPSKDVTPSNMPKMINKAPTTRCVMARTLTLDTTILKKRVTKRWKPNASFHLLHIRWDMLQHVATAISGFRQYYHHRNLVLSNEMTKVELPPGKIWKAGVWRVRLLSERITKGSHFSQWYFDIYQLL